MSCSLSYPIVDFSKKNRTKSWTESLIVRFMFRTTCLVVGTSVFRKHGRLIRFSDLLLVSGHAYSFYLRLQLLSLYIQLLSLMHLRFVSRDPLVIPTSSHSGLPMLETKCLCARFGVMKQHGMYAKLSQQLGSKYTERRPRRALSPGHISVTCCVNQ